MSFSPRLRSLTDTALSIHTRTQVMAYYDSRAVRAKDAAYDELLLCGHEWRWRGQGEKYQELIRATVAQRKPEKARSQ